MDNKRTLHQAPRPVVKIYKPDGDPNGNPELEFSPEKGRVLQSYTFTNSVNDPKGSFSLTFYPDDDTGQYKDQSIMDLIKEMYIVRIYEYIDKDTGEYPYATFTGVVRKKKLVVQKSGDDISRRVVVTGHSIAGLVHEFRISLDVQAMRITEQIANNNQIEIELTKALMSDDNKGIKVSEAVRIIWEAFLNFSSEYDKLSNPKIVEIIKKWIGENPFDIDEELTFFYPLGSVFHGQNTQNFFDVIESIIPRPVYEIFPVTEKGITRIKIRMVPFDSEPWKKLNPKNKIIDPILLKSFDVEQSDDEVYTVYYSYLSGYPMQEDKYRTLAAMHVKGMPGVEVKKDKFGIYGYRPLFLSFRGYFKSEKDDTTTGDSINGLNKKLMEWFDNLELMYNGNIAMSTDISTEPPCAGEKIPFLGGEFYVVSSEHRWNYGGNPETALAISRGGVYEPKDPETKTVEIEIEDTRKTINYTVKDGDRLTWLAQDFYGSREDEKVQLIISANAALLAGRQISAEGYPTIYGAVPWSPNPGHAADVLKIPPDPAKKPAPIKKTETTSPGPGFQELKDVSKRYQELKDAIEWTK
ncbi:hypothetical protein FACS1894106_2430 [Spirochaetia bacterium]|nr:hypothetical protein FACS1894106_2430 [Spirochaetia bacterium]